MMNMKKFIIASVLFLTGIRAFGCAFEGPTYNYYMFSVFNREMLHGATFDARVNASWMDYTHNTIKDWDITGLCDVTPAEFNKSENAIIVYARKKGDNEMLAYLRLLCNYLNICQAQRDAWTYPTKAERASRIARLNRINIQSQQYKGNRLKANYTLLTMRTFFMLKNYNACKSLWNKKAANMPASVYKDMMKDLYAGTLVRSGNKSAACDIYAELNDMTSIKWCMRSKRNLKGIIETYNTNANSPTLPYLVQDFVNNAQETLDAGNDMNIDYFKDIDVNPTYKAEVMQFIAFADNVAANGKTKVPALWKAAAGSLHYLFGDQNDAIRELDAAMNADGTQRMKDNARAIRLLASVRTAKDNREYSEYLLKEMKWLDDKSREERGNSADWDNHYTEMMERIVYNNLVPKFNEWGKTNVATALTGMMNEMPVALDASNQRSANYDADNSYIWNMDYSNNYFERLDTMNVDALVGYFNYIQTNPKNDFEKWVVSHVYGESDYYNDLIGTKMMRVYRFDEAMKYLHKVSLTFLGKQNIAPYMAKRDYTVERWFKHQKMDFDEQNVKVNITENQKYKFCDEMSQMLHQITLAANDDIRQNLAYITAVRLFQASFAGDCWYLTHYGYSQTDSAHTGETDYTAKAVEYLNISKLSSSFDMKEKSIYALAYVPNEPWGGYLDWDGTFKLDKVNRGSRQYKALSELNDLARSGNVDKYVSHCDILRYFRKTLR
jgi:hypothetical protein